MKGARNGPAKAGENAASPDRETRSGWGLGWFGRVFVVLAVVSVMVGGLLRFVPQGVPLVPWIAAFLHPLPDGTFGVFGGALGFGAISVVVGALRHSPIAWRYLPLAFGCAALSYSAVVSAAELDVGLPVASVLPVGVALVPFGIGLLGLLRLVSRRPPSSVPSLVAFAVSIAGLYLAVTLPLSIPRAQPASHVEAGLAPAP